MTVVFFLNKLRDDVTGEQYEKWVREVDYPTARAMNTIKSYVVNRIDATLEGNPSPYGYIERVEITDLESYREELANAPGMDIFFNQWSAHVGESIAVHGVEVV